MIYRVDIADRFEEYQFWHVMEQPNYKGKLYEIDRDTLVIVDPDDTWGMGLKVDAITVYVSDSTPISALSQVIMMTGEKQNENISP